MCVMHNSKMLARILIFLLIGCSLVLEICSSSSTELLRDVQALQDANTSKIAAGNVEIRTLIAKYATTLRDLLTKEGRKAHHKHKELEKLHEQYLNLQFDYYRDFRIKMEAWERILEKHENDQEKLPGLQRQAESDLKGFIAGSNMKFDEILGKARDIDKS